MHAMPAFHVRLERDGDAWSIICGGELDINGAARVDAALELCLASNPTSVFVDCRDVCFIDSTGLSALLRIVRAANELGIGHRIAVSDQVHSVMGHAGLLERMLLGARPIPATA